MMNLSLYELRQIVKGRNISNYENKSKEDLKKVIIETKPKLKLELKPETKPKQTSKPKPKPETKSEPKLKIRINKRRLEEIRKDFDELRHKFSKAKINEYRKAFYDINNFRHPYESETEKVRKNLNKLKKSLKSKKFHGNIDSVDYEDLEDNYDFADDEYRKIGSIRTLFKELDKDYYKPIRTDENFAGRKNSYIEYKSKGYRYENLSPGEYLDMIKPYLRDIAEWKIQLVMQNTFISDKDFKDTRTIYSVSKLVEIYMGSGTENYIDMLFNTILERIQKSVETSNEKEADLVMRVLLYCIIIFGK